MGFFLLNLIFNSDWHCSQLVLGTLDRPTIVVAESFLYYVQGKQAVEEEIFGSS